MRTSSRSSFSTSRRSSSAKCACWSARDITIFCDGSAFRPFGGLFWGTSAPICASNRLITSQTAADSPRKGQRWAQCEPIMQRVGHCAAGVWFQVLNNPMVTICSHLVCNTCMQEWVRSASLLPQPSTFVDQIIGS